MLTRSTVGVFAFVLATPHRSLAKVHSLILDSSISSTVRHTCMDMQASTQEKDLLVVGMGTLGRFLGQSWRESFGNDAIIYGETSTDNRHDDLRSIGVKPFMRSERVGTLAEQGHEAFSHVVFCVPPSKNQDYVEEVKEALKLWTGKGGFVFTSSGGVYAEDEGGTVNESAALSPNPRMSKILAAEEAVIAGGGTVLRLAGLYTQTRGPHTFWLSKGEVGATEEGLINLLHYEDAARATMAALLHHHEKADQNFGRVLLISDNQPLTRKQICEAAVQSPFFRGKYEMPIFKRPSDTPRSLGKVYDTSASRAALGGWTPKYPSFAVFMASSRPSEAEAAKSGHTTNAAVR